MNSHSFSDRASGAVVSLAVLLCVALLAATDPSRADQPAHRKIRVRLEADGSAAAARVSIVDAQGQAVLPTGALLRRTTDEQPYFYAQGSFDVELPEGAARMKINGGIEVVPQTLSIDSNSKPEMTVQLGRWIDMAAQGWFSGDSHVHLHTGGPLAATVGDALVAARAEGVNYVNLCVSNNHGDDIRGAELISGEPHPLSTSRHLLVFGEEMRSSIYGHMQFFGIRQLVEPQYTGFDNTPNSDDYPANLVMASEAMRQGGVVTYAHPLFANQPDPFVNDPTEGSGAARELPVDAMLGAVQAVDLISYNSDEQLSAELWYRLLNCGLKLSACVGTDALLDRSTDPLGGGRVYVQVDGPFNMQSWLEGLRDGRTLVTNGPIPMFEVDGKGPGHTVELGQPGTVQARVNLTSLANVERVELILNGKVRQTWQPNVDDPPRRPQRLQVTADVPIHQSSWLAVRVTGPTQSDVFDGPAWAHTSPVFVQVAGQPIASAEDAAYFVDWIERLLRVVALRNRYPTPEAREEVQATLRQAQDKYKRMRDEG